MKVRDTCLWFMSLIFFPHHIFRRKIRGKLKYIHTSEARFPMSLKCSREVGASWVNWIWASAHELELYERRVVFFVVAGQAVGSTLGLGVCWTGVAVK
jgi:hypothetical protein